MEAFNNMKAAASLITQEDNEVNEWSDNLAVSEKILPQDDILITEHFNKVSSFLSFRQNYFDLFGEIFYPEYKSYYSETRLIA